MLNFSLYVMTQTQWYMTGTKGMGRHKVTDSQSKPFELKQYEILFIPTSFSKIIKT